MADHSAVQAQWASIMGILLVNPPCGPRTIGMRYISRIEPLGLEQIGAGVSGQ